MEGLFAEDLFWPKLPLNSTILSCRHIIETTLALGVFLVKLAHFAQRKQRGFVDLFFAPFQNGRFKVFTPY